MSAGQRPGEVASEAGVGRETLRYYERRGLLGDPPRTLGGHRVYPPGTVGRVRMIKAGQKLGFTLDEIAALLDQRTHRRGRDGGLREGARAKLEQVERRIADLESVAELLRAALSAGCDDLETCASSPGCPLPVGAPEAPEPLTVTRL
ncbi:MerR family transcriptional regulator [Glycomyces xiaoerkulensis]|uniref:MerR family transcriptional regulator n=1 Tax=Glycomyces xiaoerkulensis TaxID=2038139 RepID=UPI000C25B4F3|nr:MerR family transcriptional regulator [Glycomyces xiaoerkulensis]